MPYVFLDDLATADVAFIAEEPTLERLFQTCGDAVINVMIEDLNSIQVKKTLQIELNEKQLDLLLFDFLQEFIFYKDAQQLLLRATTITISEGYHLTATLAGEFLDLARHQQLVDVKAVTLHQFKLEHKDSTWSAQIILDI